MIFFIFAQFALAESLFSNNCYDLAAIEYKRIFFFDSSAQKNLQLRLHYAIAIINTDYLGGYDEIERLFKDFPDLEEKARISLGKELLETKKYGLAVEILKPVKDDNGKRLLGFSYLFNHQYVNARYKFEEVDSNIAREIESYMKKSEKSITRAMLFSVFLPGTGEVYAGNIKRGLQDFILSSLSGFLLYNSIKNKKFVDAGIIFTFGFNRFYIGSISNAGRIARERNQKSEEDWLKYIKARYFQ